MDTGSSPGGNIPRGVSVGGSRGTPSEAPLQNPPEDPAEPGTPSHRPVAGAPVSPGERAGGGPGNGADAASAAERPVPEDRRGKLENVLADDGRQV